MAKKTLIMFILIQYLLEDYIFERIMNTCSDTKCTCYVKMFEHVMDCTARHYTIKEVCNLVKTYNITVLKAGENNFGHLSADVLKGCEKLTALGLHFNQIVRIDMNAFADFKWLIKLDLRANNLDLYNSTVDMLPISLKELHLGGNVPVTSPTTASVYPDLSSLPQLSTVYLDGVQAIFDQRYAMIKSLSISARTRFTYCNLKKVTNDTFFNLTSVKVLNISCCNIRSITSGAFKNLHHLEVLDLSLNKRLGFDSMSAFAYGLQFTNIKKLDISSVYPTFYLGNNLRKEHLCYLYNTSLLELKISSNRLIFAEQNACILVPKSLERLYADDNIPSFGPYLTQTGCLPNLKYLQINNLNKYHSPLEYLLDIDQEDNDSVMHQKLTSCEYMTDKMLQQIANESSNCNYIPKNGFKTIVEPTFPAKLSTVEFKDSNIAYRLPTRLTLKNKNNSLENVYFTGVRIYKLDSTIGPFPLAKKLVLSRNGCEHIGQNFFDSISTIEHLDLSENYLGSFFTTEESKTVFARLIFLQKLNLAANKITVLFSETFAHLSKLASLSLQQNNIRTFDVSPKPLNNLLELDLKYNSLSSLNEEVLHKLLDNSRRRNETFKIDLSGNYLNYGCDNLRFLRWINKHKTNMEGFKNYSYNHNASLSESSLSNLEKSCKSYTVLIVIGTISVAVFLSVTIGGVLYRNRWKMRYFLYMSKIRVFGYQRLEPKQEEGANKFDAFISYAEENLQFIKELIIPKLEGQDTNMKLCVHQRDFIAGHAISDNIIDAIKNSRKTVIILSKPFLQRKWCMYEFNMARMECIYSRDDHSHIVMVMLENVASRQVPLEMLEWINENSYIEYTVDEEGEHLFWDNLKQAIRS